MKTKVIYSIISFLIILLSLLFVSRDKVNLAYMVDSKYLPYAMVSLDSAIINKKNSTVCGL